MSVLIKNDKVSKTNNLEYFISYNDLHNLEHTSSTQIKINPKTTSYLKRKQNNQVTLFKPTSMFISSKIHDCSKTSDHTHELIVEHKSDNDEKCFVSKRLKVLSSSEPQKQFDDSYLKIDLPKKSKQFSESQGNIFTKHPIFNLFSPTTNTTLYKTHDNTDVLLLNNVQEIQDVPINNATQNAYNHIFNNFNTHENKKPLVMQAMFTQVPIRKITEQEGFSSIDQTGTYMECEMLKDDGNSAYEDTAIIPLKTNTYERGLVTFSIFLHYFLITIGAGFCLPLAFISTFKREHFLEYEWLKSVMSYFSLVIFFVIGISLILYGILHPDYRAQYDNQVNMATGATIASIGFYLVLIHCSFSLGMFSFKKLQIDQKFIDMFDSQSDDLRNSFFDTMSGYREIVPSSKII